LSYRFNIFNNVRILNLFDTNNDDNKALTTAVKNRKKYSAMKEKNDDAFRKMQN